MSIFISVVLNNHIVQCSYEEDWRFNPASSTKVIYTVFTETALTQAMKTNQMAELKQLSLTLSNPANQMSGTKQ